MHGKLIALCLLMVFAPSLWAEEVWLTLPGKQQVVADYQAGPPEAPALLILHGFLVTGAFPTIQTLANEFSAKGYTVLTPTLSLGITGRRAGLACDAIHTHSLAQDLAEISLWVDWLASHGKGPIYLIGHSFGGVQLLAYAASSPHPRVRGLVGMSLSYTGAEGEEIRTDELARAEAMRGAGDGSLGRYNLMYCHGNYTSNPESYLSYATLDRSRVLELLGRNRIPTIAIMGGEDRRYGADWVEAMRALNVSTRVIPGASHFFDGSHEFDLLDMFDSALTDLRAGS
ncbi:MAG: alpha/beta fold hydrolase [Pseudomonadota bacterium]